MSRTRRILALLSIITAFIWLTPASDGAQPEPAGEQQAERAGEAAADALDIAVLRDELEHIESRSDLSEELKAELVAAYTEAIASLETGETSTRRRDEFRQRAGSAEQRLDQMRGQLEQAPTDGEYVVPEGATVEQVEEALAVEEAVLAKLREELNELERESTKRSERRAALKNLIADARKRVDDLTGAAQTTEGAGDIDAELRLARERLARARLVSARADLESLEAESAALAGEAPLIPLRKSIVTRREDAAELEVEAIQKVVDALRKARSEQAALEAERLQERIERLAQEIPAISESARVTREVTSETTSVNEELEGTSSSTRTYERQFRDLRSAFRSTREKLARAGSSRASGLVLQRQLEVVSQIDTSDASLDRFRSRIAEVEYRRLIIADELERTLDVELRLQRVVNDLDSGLAPTERERVREIGREVFTSERDALISLERDLAQLADELLALVRVREDLDSAALQYRRYLEERVMWIPSSTERLLPSLATVSSAGSTFFNVETWTRAWGASLKAAFERPFRSVLLLTLLIASIVAYPRLVRSLLRTGERFRADDRFYFRHTAWAIVYTILCAVPLAFALWLLGAFFGLPDEQEPLAIAASDGLKRLAVATFSFEFIRQSARAGGLCEVHLGWSLGAMRRVRSTLAWFIPVIIPLALVVNTAVEYGDDAYNDSLGRAFFVVGVLVVLVACERLLRPGSAVNRALRDGTHSPWSERLWQAAYFVVGVLLVGLIMLAISGYYLAALRLTRAAFDSLYILFAIIVAHAAMMSWLLLAAKRLDRRRRIELEEQADNEDNPADATHQFTSVSQIDSQTRQLIRALLVVVTVVLLYGIWADLLPALRVADRVQLYPSVEIVRVDPVIDTSVLEPIAHQRAETAPRETAGDPSPVTQPIPGMPPMPSGGSGGAPNASGEPVTVSLGDVLSSVIMLVVVLVVARNLPGLLEITILKRLPLDSGARYAITTIARYAVLIVGISLTLIELGLEWRNVQWLAAALTFGLAFGLQEIFANFVSGLIILAERPIRVGDTVTVGTVSGGVTRIQMRATTIIDWDRKELIIPNKAIITDRIINWTLTDPTLRVVIPITVEHGTDVERVMSMLVESAREAETVLSDPPPRAYFLGMTDTGLELDVRAYIPSIGSLLAVKTEIYRGIKRRLDDAGIRIAAPRREVRLERPGDDASIELPTRDGPPDGD